MAKKRKLEDILEQRQQARQNSSNIGNTRTISTGLPTARQNIAIPRSTVNEVQQLAQKLYNRSSNLSTDQQNRLNSVVQNYTPINTNQKLTAEQQKRLSNVIQNYNGVDENTKQLSNSTANNVQARVNNMQQNNNKKWYQKFVQKSGAFDNGYQFGDISQTIGSSVLDVGLNVVKPFSDLGTGIANIGASGVAQVADVLGKDEFADRLRRAIGANESIVDKGIKLANKDSVVGDTSDALVNAYGQYLTSALGGQVLGKASQINVLGVKAPTTMMISSLGQGLKEGYSDKDYKNWEVWLNASGNAVIEGLTEGINDVLGVGGSKLSDLLKGSAMKPFKSGFAKALSRTALSSAEEGAEEVLSYLGNLALSNGIANLEILLNQGDGQKWRKEFNKDEFWESFWVGTLGALMTEAPNTMINSNIQTQQAIQEQEKALGRELSKQEKQKIGQNTLLQSEQTIQNELLGKNTQIAQNQATTMENKPISNQTQQTIQQEGKIDEKAISQEVEQELKNTNYKREESVKNFFESAKKYNKDTKSDTLKQMVRSADERGVNLRYDDSVFKGNKNINAVWKIKRDENGKIVSRDIILNPDSETTAKLEQVHVHEMTHDMEGNGKYSKMRTELLDYLKTKPEYEKAFNDLKSIYSEVYAEENITEEEFNKLVEDEVVADILGDKLGDTVFLSKLTKEKRSVSQKIYDWVVDRLNILNKKKGYKNEKLFWQDIKNKFENAFKEDFVDSDLNGKYSIDTTIQKDNQGRTLSKEQQEYFKDSKVRDENGNIDTVYHTTTNKVSQFNEFNPVGTGGYRFGKQIVNYFTNSQEMSGSYADQNYEKANTKKYTSESDIQKYLNNISNKYFEYSLKNNSDGSYKIGRSPNLNENSFYSNLKKELTNLKNNDKETYVNLMNRALLFSNPYELFENTKDSKIDDFLYNFDNKYGEYTAGETARRIMEYVSSPYEDINFKDEDDLFKNFILKMQEKFPKDTGRSNLQYEGYLNIKRPFIIDAKGRNWNSVSLKQNNKALDEINKLSDSDKKQISGIYREVKNKSEEINTKYKSLERIIQKISEEDNSIYNWFDYLSYVQKGENKNSDTLLTLIEDVRGISKEEILNEIYNKELSRDIKAIISQYGNNVIKDSSNIKTYKELYDNMNYFEKKQNFQNNDIRTKFKKELEENFEKNIELDNNELYQLAESNFSQNKIDELYSEKETTNDVVKKVLIENSKLMGDYLGENWFDNNYSPEQILKAGGYDGLIIKNTTDYGGISNTNKPANVYVTFGSNQFKSYDNTNPTENSDIRYSLSQETKSNLEAKIDRYSKMVEEMQKDGRDAEDWAPYANEILRIQDQLEGNRYSRESTGAWNEFKSKYAKNEGRGKTNAELTLKKPNKVSEVLKPKKKVSEVLPSQINNIEEEKLYNPSKKSQEYERKQKTYFKRNMSNLLGVSSYNKNNKIIFNNAIDELQKDYNKNGKISELKKNQIFEDMYQNLIKEDIEFYKENKPIKDIIRTTTLYVDEKTKSDITDYGSFKQNYFGSIRMSDDSSNIPIDTFYKELTELNPELFPDTITNTGDQLRRIAEVSKSIRKTERNISSYNDETMSKEYKRWAKNEFDNQVDYLQEQFKYINKYNEIKEQEFIKKNELYIRPEVDEIRFIYENRADLRKEVEKQEKLLLLTDREKAIVNRLLNDEMDIEEIRPGYNKNGIIKSYYAKQQLKYLDDAVKDYKTDKKRELKDIADSLTKSVSTWKDKKLGLQYSRETAIRNIRDIMSEQDATQINREIFEPILNNTAEQTRFINNYTNEINSLNLDKSRKYNWKDFDGKDIKIDEATLAQLLIEKKINEDYIRAEGADLEKIKKTADTFSRILSETVKMMDDIYIEFGYAPVEKRKNYFPHFIEDKADTFMSKISNALGIRINADDLPTDIAGRTETFKPGRAFDRNILRRTTDKTDYNALKAMDMYIQGASDIIYHTSDIQKLRAFNESIRDKFRDVEIDKKIREIEENLELTNEERANRIKEIKDTIKTPIPKFVEWLDEYTNLLANKKSKGDRQLESDLNRQMYTTMQDIESRISSNLIGGNLSVSLTNFAPLAQAVGTTNFGDILIGMIQTTQNNINEIHNNSDNFVNESDFLTSRRGSEQTQKQTIKQNISNFMGIPMQMVDNFTSESIVRAKYREYIKKGFEHEEALKNADKYARNLMGDRSKGALPTIFARKNPVTKLMTSFQVEPNNIISNYFKDMKYDADSKQQLAMQAVKLSVASYAFNTILKSIRGGSDVIPNPIGLVSKLLALAITNLDDDDENDQDAVEVLKEITSDFLGSIPFGTAIATGLTAVGIEGFEDTGKFMVSNALPKANKVVQLFDKDVSPEYKLKVFKDELMKPLIYLGLPTGGAQISKTIKGLSAYKQGGSYTYDTEGNKKLQFPIEQNAGNLLKTAVFGKYSLSGGKKYIESNFKSLNAKETKTYENSNVDFYELQDYFNYSKKEKIKKEDKINYVSNMNISDSDKFNLYKHNIISSNEREDGTSELTDAEYILKNNMATKKEYMKLYSDAEKNNIEFPTTERLIELNDNKLSLNIYMNYKIKIKKATTEKRKIKNDKDASLTDAEQSQILIDSNYTVKEKRTIYSNYIGKNDKMYQNLSKLTGNKTTIDQYLDYKTKSEELKADENEKSNIVGKTISGSKKKKVKQYIMDSEFSDIEKLYIYGSQYELNSREKTVFLNYVDNAGLDNEERNEILLKMKGTTEYKDGTITW